MSGFEQFIYALGSIVFASAIPAAMFWVIGRLERTERKR